MAHCHCPSCRRLTGAAFVTYAGYRRDRFAVTQGAPASFASSPGARRGFCRRCGSPLTFEGERWPDEVHVFVATMDAPEAMAPQVHVHVAHQMPWFRLADCPPRYPATARDSEAIEE